MELEGKVIGHYHIQRYLARGGMSEVYLAQDKHTDQSVALKVVCHDDEDHFDRFQREVTALGKLEHEHILPILEQGEDGGWHYCVMPYLEQGSLHRRLTQGPLSLEEAGRILQQIAEALQCAHNSGLLHRDIKPSNILLQDDQVYLADFGLAKDMNLPSNITQSGVLIGTPEYMAPELAEQPATTSSDLYALGVVLYQMLTGRVPFRGTSPLAIYWKHIQEPPPPPSLLNPAIPPAIERVVLRALAKDPTQRFPSAKALAEAYSQALLASEQEQAEFSSSHGLLPPPSQRIVPLRPAAVQRYGMRQALVALATVLVLFVLPMLLGFVFYTSSLPGQAPPAVGASAQFMNVGRAAEVPTPVTKSITRHPTSPTTSSGPPQVTPNSSHKPGGDGGHSHGHGHGHKHGHSHDDSPLSLIPL